MLLYSTIKALTHGKSARRSGNYVNSIFQSLDLVPHICTSNTTNCSNCRIGAELKRKQFFWNSKTMSKINSICFRIYNIYVLVTKEHHFTCFKVSIHLWVCSASSLDGSKIKAWGQFCFMGFCEDSLVGAASDFIRCFWSACARPMKVSPGGYLNDSSPKLNLSSAFFRVHAGKIVVLCIILPGIEKAFPKTLPFLENFTIAESKSRKHPIVSFRPKGSP